MNGATPGDREMPLIWKRQDSWPRNPMWRSLMETEDVESAPPPPPGTVAVHIWDGLCTVLGVPVWWQVPRRNVNSAF